MTNQHPITPPPELVQQWNNKAVEEWTEEHPARLDLFIATRAAQWGADTELEYCCSWVDWKCSGPTARLLREYRRPKPQTLKAKLTEALQNENIGEALRLVEQLDD